MWLLGNSTFQNSAITYLDFAVVVLQMIDRLNEEEFILFAVSTRLIWLRMNRVIFEDQFQDPTTLYLNALNVVELHRSATTIHC